MTEWGLPGAKEGGIWLKFVPLGGSCSFCMEDYDSFFVKMELTPFSRSAFLLLLTWLLIGFEI